MTLSTQTPLDPITDLEEPDYNEPVQDPDALEDIDEEEDEDEFDDDEEEDEDLLDDEPEVVR